MTTFAAEFAASGRGSAVESDGCGVGIKLLGQSGDQDQAGPKSRTLQLLAYLGELPRQAKQSATNADSSTANPIEIHATGPRNAQEAPSRG